MALIPIWATVLVVTWVFGVTSGILLPLVDPAFEEWPELARAGASALTLAVLLYLIGEAATHMVGRRVLSLGEAVLLRVPFVKVVYRASKQVVAAFEGPGSKAFKEVVLVPVPHAGARAMGFVTSTLTRADGSTWHAVFVPTTPNPTTGFLHILPASEVEVAPYTVEEAVKAIMSLGAMMPHLGRGPL